MTFKNLQNSDLQWTLEVTKVIQLFFLILFLNFLLNVLSGKALSNRMFCDDENTCYSALSNMVETTGHM
jgi:hypothetical protein